MKPSTPGLVHLPKRSVLTYTAHGNPNAAQPVIKALYGTAYTTKFKVMKPKGKDMKIGCLSAFWPDAHKKPKSQWTGIWDLEVPSFVKQKDLLQKDPNIIVKLANRKAGLYAQILHVGPYSKEKSNITKLHAFVKEEKLKLIGPHEEVYLTMPGPRAKTIIRYSVK
ncbi:MAG: GyrI-like domain-containing protein [Candidatus Kerfeldbacteria bacterium]